MSNGLLAAKPIAESRHREKRKLAVVSLAPPFHSAQNDHACSQEKDGTDDANRVDAHPRSGKRFIGIVRTYRVPQHRERKL